jgi:hypothetical protein
MSKTLSRIAAGALIGAASLTASPAIANAQDNVVTVTAEPAPAVTVTQTPRVKVVDANTANNPADDSRISIGNSSASPNEIKEWISVISAVLALIAPIVTYLSKNFPQFAPKF